MGEEGGIEWGSGGRARSPAVSGSGTLPEGGQPPTSWAWAAEMQRTPAGVGPSGVRTAGLPRWQLPGVRAEALCSPWRRGLGHRFPGLAARSPDRGPRWGTGSPEPCPVRPTRATMNGPAVPDPGGSGHLRPGQPSALAPGLAPPRPPGLPVRARGLGRAGQDPRLQWGVREFSGTSPPDDGS